MQQRSSECLFVSIMAVSLLLPFRAALAFQPARHVPQNVAMLQRATSAASFTTTTSVNTGTESLRRAASVNSDGEGALSDSKLIQLAKDFIDNKNAAGSGESSLDGVFDMCSNSVDLYGLTGEDVRPGFITFFEKHQNLHHELMDEPSVVGPGVVQYPFVKQWTDEDGSEQVWRSVDADKPRNKVERLGFDNEGQLIKVSVVEADVP